jgi:hypothetical protein
MSDDLKKPLESESINSVPEPVKNDPAPSIRKDVVSIDEVAKSPALETDVPVGIDPVISDNESTISNGLIGSEEVIFTQDLPPTKEFIEMRIMLNYISSIVLVFGALVVGLGYLFKEMFDSKNPDLTNVILVMMAIHFFRLIAELILMSTSTIAAKSYNFGFIDSIGSLLTMQASFFYLRGIYGADLFINCLIANIPFQFLKSLKKDKNASPAINVFFGLFEAVTLLFIGRKIATNDVTTNWDTILIFYTAVFYIVVAFLVIVLLALLFVFVAKALNSRSVSSFSGLMLLGSFGIYVLLSISLAPYCMLYLGFRKMLIGGLIKPLAVAPVDIPVEFQLSGFILIALGSLMILSSLIFTLFIRSTVLNKFKSGKSKEIVKKVYERTFILKLTAISSKLFARHPSPEEKANSEVVRTEPCVICQINKSNLIFTPCHHCIACEDCIGFFTRNSDLCPVCGISIQKVYHVNHDEENKQYTVDYSLRIDR